MTTERKGRGTARGGGPRAWEVRQPRFEADEVCPLMPVWPWGGHRGWAYDLVRFMRPRVIAELGVHWGTSLFAFAQAVKDGGLESRLVGVDTWRGDDHTGPYGNEVLDTVRGIAARFYGGVEFELLPMTFDEALARVPDGSIDLLHVDGFHEYDAVAHDFESWLAKLADDGVVLLHDVADSTGYGSAEFWHDLSARYPSFAFEHSWGLGVVFPKGRRWLDAIRKQNLADKKLLYQFRAMYERAAIEVRDTGAMAVSRLESMRAMEGIIRARDEELAGLRAVGAELDGARARAEATESECLVLRERMVELEVGLRRSEDLARRVPGLEERLEIERRRADAVGVELDRMRGRLAEVQAGLEESRARHERATADLEAARARAAELIERCDRGEERIAELGQERRAYLARLADVEERHAVVAADLQALVLRVGADDERIGQLREQIREKDAMTNQLKETIERLSADLEMIAMRVEQLERLEIEREKLADERGDGDARGPRGGRERRGRVG